MYLAQRQQRRMNSDRQLAWQNFLDVRETTIEELMDLCTIGTTVYTDRTNEDVVIVAYPGGGLRDLVIAEDWRSTIEMYYALNGR